MNSLRCDLQIGGSKIRNLIILGSVIKPDTEIQKCIGIVKLFRKNSQGLKNIIRNEEW